MAEKACKLLHEVDYLFTDGNVDVTKYNAFTACHSYCPYENRKSRPCKNNYERINALGVYLYQKLAKIAKDFKGEGDNGNRHIEIFMMWLGDKLYKIDNDYKKTLEESYKNYLDSHTGNYKYWNVVGSKKEYKIANVWYMSELYKLLNCICNIIIEYNKKNKNKTKIENYSSQCHQKFTSIYKDIKDCYSYFHLLKFLKKIYDDVRNDAIKRDNDLKANIRKAAARRTPIISETIKKFNIPHQIKDSKKILEYVLNASTVSLIDLTPSDWNQRFPNDSDNITDFHTQKCVNSYHEFVEEVKKQKELESKNRPKAQPHTDPSSTKLPAQPQASQQSGTSPQSGTKDSGTQKGNSDSEGGGKGGTNNLPGSTGGGHGAVTGGPDKGAPSLQSDHGGSSGGSGSSVSGTGGINGTSGSQGGSSNQGGSVDGSKASGDQAPPHSSGASNGYLPNNWEMNFNLTDYMPSVSGMYESSKNILTNTANQITSAYNSAKAIAQDTYNKTVSIAKDTYSATTNYIGGAVNSITNQFNPFGTSQLGDNQSGSNNLGGGTDTSNQSQPNPKHPVNPSPSPSPSDPPSLKSLDPQPIPTHISKNSDQQSTSNAGKGVPQIPLSAQGTLPSSSTGPSTQWNGSTPEIVVKMIEKPSIWCIAQNKKYDILGIGIIIISIFAFLAIMYKYLSLGCTSKSKRKKSMKKVINSIGGKRPIQIIIKSYDRNKDLKPVINSVGRKKDPLLNIYKLMQADPVPFINVFFLLIFFVYKRQLNYLKL
ncbi:PIR protein CIR protein [Plasmodium vinckei petteri]|uniref:PIR protein CIR protein n=1 Tax=Plasmodium vinckei petteri TaxID=138298 RepID=A0A6V7TAD5_PLAVN|nr:PIR protein CIR protein [Plasmodium vinckei petteri]